MSTYPAKHADGTLTIPIRVALSRVTVTAPYDEPHPARIEASDATRLLHTDADNLARALIDAAIVARALENCWDRWAHVRAVVVEEGSGRVIFEEEAALSV